MFDIYEKHQNAFANVSAHVIVKGGERVATIAFKFPKDGGICSLARRPYGSRVRYGLRLR